MRDDFKITVPPIDSLVDIVKSVIGESQGGVRMTGGVRWPYCRTDANVAGRASSQP